MTATLLEAAGAVEDAITDGAMIVLEAGLPEVGTVSEVDTTSEVDTVSEAVTVSEVGIVSENGITLETSTVLEAGVGTTEETAHAFLA
jgi:hypothetical protein